MKPHRRSVIPPWALVLLVSTLALTAATAAADAPQPAAAASASAAPVLSERDKALLAINWQQGPIVGALGAIGELKVPEGVIYADGDGTRRFLELNENPTNGRELGMIAATDFTWVATFEFSDIGHVKDDDKAELDADAILKSLREGNDQGNTARRARGWGTVTLDGWATTPRYDEVTHNLEWGTRVRDDKDMGVTINHSIRVLGREGVMEISVMTGPEVYAGTLPSVKKLLDGYSFKSGHQYSEWRQGERVAEIGLAGLITGGVIAVAAKTGILAKLGKGVVKLVAVGAAGISALLAKIFGKKKTS